MEDRLESAQGALGLRWIVIDGYGPLKADTCGAFVHRPRGGWRGCVRAVSPGARPDPCRQRLRLVQLRSGRDSRKGRWGLKLGVEQHTDRLSEWRDVQPGLYYKLTPRLNIGGAVSLSEPPAINPRQVDPQGHSPRVRLETTFKF